MNRKDRELTWEEAEKILIDGEWGVLSLSGPYAVPMNYAYKDGVIYLHASSREGERSRRIRESCDCFFSVVSEYSVLSESFSERYESAAVRGTIAEADKREALIAILEKYSPQYMEAGLQYIERAIDKVSCYKIVPSEITGKAHR